MNIFKLNGYTKTLGILLLFAICFFGFWTAKQSDSKLLSSTDEPQEIENSKTTEPGKKEIASETNLDADAGLNTEDQVQKNELDEPTQVVAGQKGFAAGGGLQYLEPEELKIYMDEIEELGAKWIRFDFAWSDMQPASANATRWQKYDRVVDEANSRNISVLGMIGYTPQWARDPNCNNDKCAPIKVDDYANFVGKVVSRYKDKGVNHWEIWNEPNIDTFWQPRPSAQEYSKLLQAAYIKAKASNPNAYIITGGTAPSTSDGVNIAPIDFLNGIYENSAQSYFDAVGHHPYCFAGTFDCPSEYAIWSAWSQMQDTPSNLRNIMENNQDSDKKIWATEFGAPTQGENSVSEEQQADMLKNSFELLASTDWAGPLFWYSYQDAGTNVNDREDWFGVIDSNGSKKPAANIFSEAN